MSTFGDYKSYKKYAPAYELWKENRGITEAKRQAYLALHPEEVNYEDVQRGKTLLRSIDIMDEYSQKRAEDMEVATETVVSEVTLLATMAGAALGAALSLLKPVRSFFNNVFKGSKNKYIGQIAGGIFGGIAATAAAFPLYAWAAKAEVSASRRGRFEAMRKDLASVNAFAALTDEQIKEAEKRVRQIVLPEEKKKKPLSQINNGIASLKEMASDSKEYKQQRKRFELELQEDNAKINEYITPEELEKAKKDKQLLTKLVEKIDIASQDYAENAELTAGVLVVGVFAFGELASLLAKKGLEACKIKSANKISIAIKGLGFLAVLGSYIFMAQVSKKASRIGRYKVKKELQENPEKLVYVSDDKTSEIENFKIEKENKSGIFAFLKTFYGDMKEYDDYKKNGAVKEKKFVKAVETLELSEEQRRDAKRLQQNTFRTFNKIDENSQKYSESVEALGQAISQPIMLLVALPVLVVGTKYLSRAMESKNRTKKISNYAKYISISLLSAIPGILINAVITREQKKSSRVADMLAINEMQDDRQFVLCT